MELINRVMGQTGAFWHKFNGMEWQNEMDLNYYDFGMRNYDPALGRWMNVDPLADHPKQIGFSPYAYAANNPVRYIDPDGRLFDDYEFNIDTGELKLVKETEDDFDMIYATKENENGEIERTGESIKVNDTNVLDRDLGDIDFSERGLIFQIGDLENGIEVMNFLSFKSKNGRELSALGFSEKGSNSSGLFINPWKWNTSTLAIDFASMEGKSKANELFKSETTGNVSFKIHTHPRTSNYTPSGRVGGDWGDLNSYNPKYPHYIQSEYGEASQYNNRGYSRQNRNFLKKYF